MTAKCHLVNLYHWLEIWDYISLYENVWHLILENKFFQNWKMVKAHMIFSAGMITNIMVLFIQTIKPIPIQRKKTIIKG